MEQIHWIFPIDRNSIIDKISFFSSSSSSFSGFEILLWIRNCDFLNNIERFIVIVTNYWKFFFFNSLYLLFDFSIKNLKIFIHNNNFNNKNWLNIFKKW